VFDVFSVKTKYNITVNTGKKTSFLVKIDHSKKKEKLNIPETPSNQL